MPKTSYDKHLKRWVLQGQKNGRRKKFYSTATGYRDAKRECEAQYQQWLSAINSPGGIRFSEAWQQYLDDYAHRYKASSTRTLELRGQAYLLPAFSGCKLSSITRSDWQAVVTRAADRGLSKATLKGIAVTIRTFCRFCAALGYIADAYVPQNFFISAKAPVGTKRALYPAELAQLLSPDIDYESWYIPHFRFLALTGLRRGELCALRRDRDLKMPYVYIRESLSHELLLGTPKSGKSRKEYLTNLAQAALSLHETRCRECGFSCDYLFLSSTGHRTNPKVLSEAWRTYRKQHKLGALTLHELRHTFATYSDKNLGLEDLKVLLGHSKSMDTRGTYVHDVPLTEAERLAELARDQKRAQKISAIFEMIKNL